MCKSFHTVLLSAVVLVVALSFGSAVAAQEESTSEETTSEETTVLGVDAANKQIEAETDNVSVESGDGEVSAKTSDVPTSNETSSQQSSVTVQQNQADEGSGSEANTGDVNVAQNSSCRNPDEVLSVGPTTNNIRRAFETTGNTFRVTYDVDFTDDNDFSNFADIDIEDNFGLVEFVNISEDDSNNLVVTEGAGNYDLVVNIDPPNGARYTVTVDDCRGSGDNNDGNRNNNRNNRNNRNNDNNRNTRIIRINDDNDGGAANRQYSNEVIVKTIPDKGRLADTGGSPLILLAGAALLSTGLLVGRSVFRRDP